METEPLDDLKIAERIAQYTQSEDSSGSVVIQEEVSGGWEFIRPTSGIGESLIEVIRNPEGRIKSGFPDIDIIMRGLGKGELCYLTGYTQGGKTQVFLNWVRHNHDKNIVLFTMDEPAEMVLAKLIAMDEGWDFNKVEEQVKEGNQQIIARIHDGAENKYKNLLIIDQRVTLDDMTSALREAENYFSGSVHLVGVDYLRLLKTGEADTDQGIVSMSVALKHWTAAQNVPVICIQQGSRSKTSNGQKIGLNSMEYGGEYEAHFVLGVRRLRDDEDLSSEERLAEENTINISLVKSKRLPPRLGEFRYFIHPTYGIIRPLNQAEGLLHNG